MDYHYEGDVYYRTTDKIREDHEVIGKYSRYHNKKFIDSDEILLTRQSDLYKLINHWNRVNRIQGGSWYYEAEP